MNTAQITIPKQLIDAFKKHIPMHVVCDYLKSDNKKTARSWDDIFLKNSIDHIYFENLLFELVCFGKKTIFAFDADGVNLSALDLQQNSGLSIADALHHKTENQEFYRAVNNGAYSAYIFITTRPAQETYVLAQSDLTSTAQQKFWKPSSVIRLRSDVMVTTFDSIIFDHVSNILFVAVDNQAYTFEKSGFDIQSELVANVSNICPTVKNCKLIDIYPAIDGLYLKSSEGLVHRLAFECNTGAIRDERLKQGQLDLRCEIYHTSGKAAIGGKIRPYKIGTTWIPAKYPEIKSEIDFEISGTRQNLHKGGGVFDFSIKSLGSFDEMCFALNRLALYIF